MAARGVALMGMLGLLLSEDKIDVDVQAQLPAEASEVVERLHAARRLQEEAARQAQELAVDAVEDLVSDRRLSYRDVGHVVGLSHQRISQVVKAGRLEDVCA